MSGRILIVETTRTKRLFLRGQIESAHYTVQATGDLGEAKALIATEAPDLVLLDIAGQTQAALALCASLRAQPQTALLPVIALDAQPGTEERLAALKAGADDILDKRGDATYLMARIRSLLRVRDAASDLAPGLVPGSRMLGLAEPSQGFVPAGRIAIITRRLGSLPANLDGLTLRLPGAAVLIDPDADISAVDPQGGAQTDLFVIDHAHDGAVEDRGALSSLLADLQSRPTTRLARTLVIVPEGAGELAQMALDLAADDLVTSTIGPEELAFRIRALLRRKTQADRRRSQITSNLAAVHNDALTGIRNRRFAMEELDRLVIARQEDGPDFAVIVLDIDHFKHINDNHGHPAGDLILREVAALLRANLRESDMIARIGGEEFMAILPATTMDRARTAAERLRRVVEDSRFLVAGLELRVTLSAGVASGGACPGVALTPQDIFLRADQALYSAKSSGRNMVAVASAA